MTHSFHIAQLICKLPRINSSYEINKLIKSLLTTLVFVRDHTQVFWMFLAVTYCLGDTAAFFAVVNKGRYATASIQVGSVLGYPDFAAPCFFHINWNLWWSLSLALRQLILQLYWTQWQCYKQKQQVTLYCPHCCFIGCCKTVTEYHWPLFLSFLQYCLALSQFFQINLDKLILELLLFTCH